MQYRRLGRSGLSVSLGNFVMVHLVARASGVGCSLAASVLLLTACTSGSEGDEAAKASPPTAPSASHTSAGPSEQQLADRAQAALAAFPDGEMVAAGSERVSDGIHTEPALSAGRTYRLSLICFGSGSARLAMTPANTTASTVAPESTQTPESAQTPVPCDQSVVQQRITVHKPVRIDVNSTKGSSGGIAWRIDAV
ncbi:hypothetical protein [Streptomyces sp. NPDC102462]|uniref:hypothetical protein n=1 Tax=Streptomyces sp. NPDC102462 TaxID=3366178 RepID=UPI003825EFF5